MTSNNSDLRTTLSPIQAQHRDTKSEILAWLMSGLFGILSGLFLVWGYQLEKIDRIDLSDNNANLVMVMLMIVMAVDAKHVWNNYNAAIRGEARLFGLFKIYSNDPETVKKKEEKQKKKEEKQRKMEEKERLKAEKKKSEKTEKDDKTGKLGNASETDENGENDGVKAVTGTETVEVALPDETPDPIRVHKPIDITV